MRTRTTLIALFCNAVRFQLDQLNKEFNALNKEIATVRKVRDTSADQRHCGGGSYTGGTVGVQVARMKTPRGLNE